VCQFLRVEGNLRTFFYDFNPPSILDLPIDVFAGNLA
jgi:hypothetical protein